jgi:transaldolase
LKVLIASIDEKKLVAAKDYAVHGIITNPTIVAQVNEPWKKSVSDAAEIVDGPFHLQITEDRRDDIIKQAEEFSSVLGDRLIVKMCLTQESLAAMQVLQARGFKINLTGIVSIPQSFFAIQAGADLISIYMGRADDVGGDGVGVVKAAADMVKSGGYKTEIVAASIRGVSHYVEATKAGADWAACPYEVLPKLIRHPVTDTSIVGFARDWNNVLK